MNDHNPYQISTVTLDELNAGLVHAARLVRRYGNVYWPVVKRLQAEVKAIKTREAVLSNLLGDAAKFVGRGDFG